MTPSSDLQFLFPKPKPPPSTLSPPHWPGISAHSTTTLQTVLKDNHERWHIFFNDQGFHNHASHRALALWGLGADAAIIEAGYKKDCGYERPAFGPPGKITTDNFADHVGDERYYRAYLTFFTHQVKSHGISHTLEHFVFSKHTNVTSEHGKHHPQMLSRFFAGLVHPMIHTGYGTEFGLPGMVVEGLSQTAVHRIPPSTYKLFPTSLFDSSIIQSASSALDTVTSKLPSSLSLSQTQKDTHALTILSRVYHDTTLHAPTPTDQLQVYEYTLQNYGEAIASYAAQWSIDTSKPDEVSRKLEELAWMNVVIYGISGWTARGKVPDPERGNGFNADFFFMHLVTSSLFLPSLLATLSPSSQSLLLRTYLSTVLGWYVARGRPALDLKGFFTSPHAPPVTFTPPGPQPHPNKHALPGEFINTENNKANKGAVTPNVWLAVIQSASTHPDEHLTKLQRALAHWGSLFGDRGHSPYHRSSQDKLDTDSRGEFADVELPGVEYLDGTLFVRTAGLTAGRMAWVREGQEPPEFWDREGFYKEGGAKAKF